jgi:uncharacterized protein YlxW (UPF0749 family)
MPETPADDGRGRVPGGLPKDAERHDAGRERLWRALTRPQRSQVVVAVLLALVGFGAITQVRANSTDDTYAGLRQQDLIDVLDGLAGTSQRAQDEIQKLQKTRDDLQSDTSARQAALDQARKQSDTLGILAGVVPVRGPGVVITIKEDRGQVDVGAFLDMVEALRTAGAEAMQVNGKVRVVAQTSFEDGVGGLLVDGTLLSAPFTVTAIGDPDALGSALKFPDGPVDEFQQDDAATLTYVSKDVVTIQAVRSTAEADYAKAQQ